ncbi:hypothetical protein AUEXF2481DRAFT_533207 [Aureobasidium subglaciale EXF-2481]|uniref:Uncharacterized protein n=1 Tax=Aureobasidium subglaciale (strain EXF-2481) TaxID=1043005 RepID=A0A074Y413_AURSE|nr:uncharacterized protein AUEXF2481DRAFT_533207 [Aureobasidium subglaciale EXF-2481]KEQ90664.1 hypothetical protein AUEXF2481DRAFT_533207 [Aureobasidium subglaciale EXF-2481]
MLQQPSSQDVIMSCSESTIGLIECCLPIMRDKCLRSSNVEPWCYVTICACLSLLEVHLGKCDHATAKYSCAQKFLDVFKKNTLAGFQPLLTPQDVPQPAPLTQAEDDASASSWLETDIFDSDVASFNHVMDLEGMYNV